MNIETAVAMHAAGNLTGAEQAYRAVLSQDKKNHVAMEQLAIICLTTGRIKEGKELLGSAIRLDPKNPEIYYNLAAAHKFGAEWSDVIPCCRKALELGGKLPEVYLLLGEALQVQGRTDEALSSFHKALELRPKYAEVHNHLGMALLSQGNLEEALNSLKKSVEVKPDYGHGYYNMGLVLQQVGRFDEAIAACNEALKSLPIAECYLNLGNALFESRITCADSTKRMNEAVIAFNSAINLKPDFADAHANLGLVLRELGRPDDAITAYKRALELNPWHAGAYHNIAIVFDQQFRSEEALVCHQSAFDVRCQNLETPFYTRKMGNLLLQLRKIPVIYSKESEIQACRDAYTTVLDDALALFAEMPRPFDAQELAALKEVLFITDNFFLGYQQLNDKELATKYAKLATEILKPEIGPFLTPVDKPRSGGKIRVGIATEQLWRNNASDWALGWLSNLSADDYEFFLYSINGLVDETTKKFASLGTYRWLPFREHNYLASAQVIKEDNLDVLLITDVGTSARNRILSLLRLAPIQCAGWAYPVTSGSPNYDYFLSNELMETAESGDHYSEELVRLPKIGLHLEYPDNTDVISVRSAFELPEDKIIYGSIQSPFKYLPQYDFIYPAIAKQVPDAFFVFVSHLPQPLTAVFETRLRASFDQAGVSFNDHVKILPRLKPTEFMQVLAVLDVNLDSIGWTGGFTTMQSLAMDCPVVTLPGEFMRGRHSCAMLTMIDTKELIADCVDDYISIACNLGSDKELRASLVEKIKANKQRLFQDKECVHELDRFFKSKVGALSHRLEYAT